MKKLLSLPPNLVDCFHDITGLSREEWFCTNDPVGAKLGSGGGTTWLMQEYEKSEFYDNQATDGKPEKRLILHAGGQSRRLPAYAPSGKILTPIPVFRWERGQRLSQDLLSLQVPLYEKIMSVAPDSLRTMIVSGDVYIRATQPIGEIPDADVVCYGLWLGPEIACDHGIFVSSHEKPGILKCMMQKPSVQTLSQLLENHYYLTDIGIWLLSDKAMQVLRNKSLNADGSIREYDLYSEFGCGLGTDPTTPDDEVSQLSVAILPLPGGEFYHYGTTHEILSSTLAVQNIVNDQREIMHHSRRPHPALFVQNSELKIKLTDKNQNIWIENSWIGEKWTLTRDNVITGVPENDWEISLQPGQCIDIVPIGEKGYAVRTYGFNDKFAGQLQFTPVFPVVESIEEIGEVLKEKLQAADSYSPSPALRASSPQGAREKLPFAANGDDFEGSILTSSSPLGERMPEGQVRGRSSRRISAEQISSQANLRRLTAQRKRFRALCWPALAENYRHSVFFQTDLGDAAQEFAANNIAIPQPISEDNPLLTRVHDNMFRAEVKRLRGEDDTKEAQEAFRLLRQGLTETVKAEIANQKSPRMSVYGDQIVWGRSPVRIDIAGGWTDTPPYCLMEGGNVINLAIELNGQPPLQAYVKPCKEHHIILRSIDLGASEVVKTYEELADFYHVGSPFSIPKAALVLAGFQPGFCIEKFESLEKQLKAFGCGIELTMLSAIPAGSGLGTSSILASTVLGALNDFCGLAWDKQEIGRRTLVLEQLLTTGGGWQDQFGGLLQGIKLLQTSRGFDQSPTVHWLPSELYTQPEYRQCHLLYYTGITRTAKTLLAEIVRRMFLNNHDEIALLRDMKEHTFALYETIQRNDFVGLGKAIRKTWAQNQAIDGGTNPAGVKAISDMVDDLCLGYKLPGAGGGGYLYMVAKDPDAAARIRQILNANPQNSNARFVDMTLSEKGLQVSRS